METKPPSWDHEVLGIKKGPWSSAEDLILASYIEEHGPGNWRFVPTNTGLLRCGKSCRLRWSNYLRPGIKRGNFTELEEKMIISLQSIFGNKWASISSYLPQRTDSDIKNYWNTYLKKKLRKIDSVFHPNQLGSSSPDSSTSFQISNSDGSKSYDSIRNSEVNNFLSNDNASIPSSTTYALSTENISKLLEGWSKPSPDKLNRNTVKLKTSQTEDEKLINKKVEVERTCNGNGNLLSNEDADYFESILKFENVSNYWKQTSSSDSTTIQGSTSASPEIPPSTTSTTSSPIEDKVDSILKSDNQGWIEDDQNQPLLSLIENWLMEDLTGDVPGEDLRQGSLQYFGHTN